MKSSAWVSLLVFGCIAPFRAQASEAGGQPLRFEEVKQSVNAHDPRIRQAIEKLRAAEGKTTEARGAFDPRLEGDARLLTGAYYDLQIADAELRQPTTLWGSEIYFGYRIGLGVNDRWPTYRDDQTLSGGEVRAGIELPIWRGGPIDPERANRERAINLQDTADEGLSATRLDLELAAARAYWQWVSTGQNRQVARELLNLAEQRDQQLRRRLGAGSIAEFDVVDNERILLERKAFLVAAERAFEKAAFALSLFFRDENGAPIVVDPARVPAHVDFEEVGSLAVESAVEQVLMCHPEVEAAKSALQAAEVDVRLTRNALAPELEAFFQYSRDLGQLTNTDLDFTLPGNVFEAGVTLSMPLIFRTERGRATTARAVATEKREALRWVTDKLRARTQDAASALLAAQERAALNREVVETAAELAEGERRRFEVGASNLIFVNLREQQAAMARMRFIEAIASAEIERTRWHTTIDVPCD
jgi:outer membrane protein TolC